MEQFCRALHPDLGLSPTCLSWFRQATDHCTGIIMHNKPGSHFWNTVKNFIFPDKQTALLNQNIPISIHPNRLSMQDCHSLFLDIVNDYVLRAPRYSAEAATNALLWQILYSLMGIMALGTLLVTTMFGYRKFGRFLRRKSVEDVVFAPEQRAHAYINHNVRVLKHELRKLRVHHLVQPEELFAPDGTATLVVRLTSKLKFLDTIVTSQEQAMGRLYRLHELMGKKNAPKPDFKVETVNKALKFLNNYSQKLHVLLVFDEEPLYEHYTRKRKTVSPPKVSPPKISPPKITPPKPSPPRYSVPNLQKVPSQTSTALQLQVRKCGSTSFSSRTSTPRFSTPRSISPAKPRSPRNSTLIPRTFGRRTSSQNITYRK